MIGLRSGEASRLLFVVTAKNPYSWLLSMWRHPYHYVGDRPATFEKFLRRPWAVVGRERFDACGGEEQRHSHHQRHFKGPVDMWNRKMRSFAELAAPHLAKVRYEDLVADPAAVVGFIKSRFGLDQQVAADGGGGGDGGGDGGFQNVESSTKTKSKDYGSYRDFYLKELWKDKWDCLKCLKYANAGLDDEVLSLWSYPRWSGPSEQEVNRKLNGEPSWMVTPKQGNINNLEGGGTGSGKPPTFVSAATLARQKEQAAKGNSHNKHRQSGSDGHSPSPQHNNKKLAPNINRPQHHGRAALERTSSSSSSSSPGSSNEHTKAAGGRRPVQGGWEAVGINPDYSEVPAHRALGGPMDSASSY